MKRAIVFTLTLLPFTLPAQRIVPSAQEKTVLSYFKDVLDRGKAEVLDSLFLPDCAIHRPEGDFNGITALRTAATSRRASFSSFKSELHDIFEASDRVVVRLTHEANGAGAMRFRVGMRDLTGKTVRWDAIAIFRFQNGKIAEEWVNRDELGMLMSAGVLEAEGVAR
jgi:predicted ester cyclase